MRATILWLTIFVTGCTTPYSPLVQEVGGHKFPGISQIVEESPTNSADVVAVHGMCTHDIAWAEERIASMAAAFNAQPARNNPTFSVDASIEGITTISRTYAYRNGEVRFSAIVWSDMTATLKSQLAYDKTATATDCSSSDDCKPERAFINGKLKDGLLNDCLADALIYQGESRNAIRSKVAEALSVTLRGQNTLSPLVVVTESLGSKVVFDALQTLVQKSRAEGQSSIDRLALLFMQANQLPILSLAEQIAEPSSTFRGMASPPTSDSLAELLKLRDGQTMRAAGVSRLNIVAFTDPNDLLSYRLEKKRYEKTEVKVSNVLVSNAKTIFGWLERPDTAHTDYRKNAEITRLIACGSKPHPNC